MNTQVCVSDDANVNTGQEMTDDTLMTIREMCDTFEVTPRTLRFYEQKELLFPIREGQKRLFTRRDRARLKLILRGKRFGFSLEEIRQLLDLYHVGDQQRTQIEKTYRIAQQRLDDLKAQRAQIDQAIRDLEEQMEWGERVLAEMTQTQNAAE
jgi:DNA-binding transcriptional MerR regulator